jgi:hypothetical protein
MRYEHTQRSYLLHWIVVPLFLVTVVGMFSGGSTLWAWVLVTAFAVAFAWLVVTFSMLTVIVDGDQIRVYFGRGWPRKTVSKREVTSVRPVRNQWWYGLGIRFIPKGTLWNVWGLGGVELRLESGRVFRIGTDDVDGLTAAIAL